MNVLAATIVLAQLVSSHQSAPAEAPTSAGGLQWSVPKGWTVAPKASSMRVATYQTPRAPGDPEDPEVAIFYFGQGQGGTTESNVQRWISQLQPEGKPVSSTRKIDVKGIPVTLVSAEGTYEAGMSMGAPASPKKGWALAGAIAEGPKGSVFFKLTGPKKSVAKAQPELDALVKSLRK